MSLCYFSELKSKTDTIPQYIDIYEKSIKRVSVTTSRGSWIIFYKDMSQLIYNVKTGENVGYIFDYDTGKSTKIR